MRSPYRWALGLTAMAAASTGCARRSAPAVEDSVVAERARAALAPFKSQLKSELGAALAVSPESAVDVCAARAPALARAASHDGVTVGRSAIRLRSEASEPRPWVKTAMAAIQSAPSGSDAHRVVPIDGGRRGYVEAIWVAAPCLTCHGETLAPNVDAALRAKYPQDSARGFKAGDFRGVFWAELDESAVRP